MTTRKPSGNSSSVVSTRATAKQQRPEKPSPIQKEASHAVSPAPPVVGIGASAGGLEAFEKFFGACPADSGMAFVLVPHLDPSHDSLLTEILQRSTAMPVVQALDQVAVAANHVYVIPPNREMAILNGVLQLSTPDRARGQRLTVDGFLRSLAEDQGHCAIGIVLSGTATDGTLGLRAIHGTGGVCMVQDPSTAKYDGMPQSAIAAGYATHILSPEKMPAKLLDILRQSSFGRVVPALKSEKVLNGMNQILLQLRSSTGHDFSLYKKTTIARRIERRMVQHDIADMAVYARLLREHPAEARQLFKELLINVTSFFRDPEAFAALKSTILPPLLADKPAGYVFRVWVPGCASGEEAYSIAMVLRELQDEMRALHDRELSIQIYATDLDDDAIATARAGHYPSNIVQDVTPERLKRFFSREPEGTGGFKVKKEIRDLVVFAVQSVIKDPPFTRLDLLSCRNLMIYLEPEQQHRLIPTFHYALKPGGVLFLSASESITNQPELFSALDRKWKFYRAVHSAAMSRAQVSSYSAWAVDNRSMPPDEKMIKPMEAGLDELARRALLQSYAPASVVTDRKGNILYVYGDTGKYLRPAPGKATLNVGDMAREGLELDLRTALLDMNAHEATSVLNREVSIKTNDGFSRMRFSVRRMSTQSGLAAVDKGDVLLVSFADVYATAKPAPRAKGNRGSRKVIDSAEQQRIAQLEHELAYARESRQVSTEEQQAVNEELKSTNEELQSANEELQSSNEELETSKEELQSLNEEIITVNAELNSKIEQLSETQHDMKNLLDSVSSGTFFLGNELCIRRYTPAAVKLYRVIPADIGRPLADIKSRLVDDDLQVELQSVLDTLVPVEREVRTQDGEWYLARMQPYRTLDNVIAGVVLTFTEVTAFKLASEAVGRARALAEAIIDAVSEPLIVLDANLGVVSASRSFYQYFKVTAAETEGRRVYDLGDGQWNIPALRELLEDILPQRQVMDGFVVEHDFPTLGARRLVLNARRIVSAAEAGDLILLAMVSVE